MNTLFSAELSQALQAVATHPEFVRTAPWMELSEVERNTIKLGWADMKTLLGQTQKLLEIHEAHTLKAYMGKYQANGNVFPYIWGAWIPQEVENISQKTPQLFLSRNSLTLQVGIALSHKSREDAEIAITSTPFFQQFSESTFLQNIAQQAGLSETQWSPRSEEHLVAVCISINSFPPSTLISFAEQLVQNLLNHYMKLVQALRDRNLFDNAVNHSKVSEKEGHSKTTKHNEMEALACEGFPNEATHNQRNYWKISCGIAGKYAGVHKTSGRISIGWNGTADLLQFNSKKELNLHFDSLENRDFEAAYASSQCWTFAHEIKKGDIIFGYGGGQILLIGEVESPYVFLPTHTWAGNLSNKVDENHRHTIPVKWFDCESVDKNVLSEHLRKKFGLNQTLFPLSREEAAEVFSAANIKEIDSVFVYPSNSKAAVTTNVAQNTFNYPLQEKKSLHESTFNARHFAQTFGLEFKFVESIQRSLTSKKQVIFQGPPGTGKTFVANALAEFLQPSENKRCYVQFHPNYSYEDFVEGIRPQFKGTQAGFEIVPGVFRNFCMQALKDPNSKYIFLLDEINRGNLPQIFGELLSLLEYRSKALTLPYSKEMFVIPDNVLLIGTMNSADRSLALIDLAIRRRFDFFGFFPNSEALKNALTAQNCQIDIAHVVALFEGLNQFIIEELGKDFQIGQSFFLRKNLNEEDLNDVWEHSIFPTLQEYFFDKPEKIKGLSYSDFLPFAEKRHAS